jgi:cytochrome c oxidase accessory protein FixG
VDCKACVTVCPTGIDIRNGSQLECVNCTACIDACDDIMLKLNRPTGLIRYASQNNIATGQPQRFSTRMVVYSFLLAGLVTVFGFLLFTRADVETTLQRQPGSLYTRLENGQIANVYTLQFLNKTTTDKRISLRLAEPAGATLELTNTSHALNVPAEQVVNQMLIVEVPQASIRGLKTPLVMEVYENDVLIDQVETSFLGPVGQ